MILIVGGIASGKRTYARSLGYGAGDFSAELDAAASVLVDAEELVREGAVSGQELDVRALAAELAARKDVVLCQEVGNGIVPLDRGERAWRERVGALQKALASEADVVVRTVCGIPVALKGELPGKEA